MFSQVSKFLNATYLKDGRTYSKVDCYGICYLFNKDFLNVNIPEFASFENSQNCFNQIKMGKEKKGDIISFNIKGYPVHVGVVIDRDLMLHIMEKSYPKIENYKNNKWLKRINSIWRYNGSDLQKANI